MTHGERAAEMGLTFDEYQRYRMMYLQSEGYSDDGVEHATLASYVTAVRTPSTWLQDRTPWQKGDDCEY